MPTMTVTAVLITMLIAVAVILTARFLVMWLLRKAAFKKAEQELLRSFGGYCGVEADFGCGHRQRIQLLEKGGCIFRNVPYDTAHYHNCHICWSTTGVSDRRCKKAASTGG